MNNNLLKQKGRQFAAFIFRMGSKLLTGTKLARIYPMPKIRNLFINYLRINTPAMTQIGGNIMYLDYNDTLDLSIRGSYEPFEADLFKNEIQPGDIVLDIGAHIGYYTLIAAQLVGSGGRVFAFEPEPKNFSLLEKNIKINNYSNIVAVQKAVSDKSATLKLYLAENNSGDHRIYDPNDGRSKFINIEVVKLDDFFKDYNRINVVKIDVQGAEGGVLKGMENLIQYNKNIKIFTEFGISEKGNMFRIPPMEYLKLLKRFGFCVIYHINEKTKKFEFFNINSLIKRYPFQLDETVNFLCKKAI